MSGTRIPLLREMKRLSLGCCLEDAMLSAGEALVVRWSVTLLAAG